MCVCSFGGTKKECNASEGESERDESTNAVTAYASSPVAAMVRVTPCLNGSVFEAGSVNLM